jgi:hypothetical protein
VRQLDTPQQQRNRKRVSESVSMSTDDWRIGRREQFLEDSIPTLYSCFAFTLAIPEEILRSLIDQRSQSLRDYRRKRTVDWSAGLLGLEKQLVAIQARTLQAGGILKSQSRMAQ